MSDDHPLVWTETLVLIAIGAFVGANARYFIGLFRPGLLGTFVANVLGSFVLGFLTYEAAQTGLLGDKTDLVVGTGFLSSFTTYSTFALETVQATPLFGVLNVVGSYAVGFSAVYGGRFVATTMRGA